jgi:uncharacterized protein (TIGR00251 family)
LKEKDKIYLTVNVQPRAQNPGIEKLDSGEYKVRVHAPPTKGEANKEVVKTVASHFGVPSSWVKIVRGMKSRKKAVLIELDRRG